MTEADKKTMRDHLCALILRNPGQPLLDHVEAVIDLFIARGWAPQEDEPAVPFVMDQSDLPPT